MEEKLDIIAIGESLVELSSEERLSNSQCLYKYYGGDTLVCAITAQRLGAKVGFITRVGNDAFRDFLMDSWQAEGQRSKMVYILSQLLLIVKPSLFITVKKLLRLNCQLKMCRKII